MIIYGLKSPNGCESVRYIGLTELALYKRYGLHLSAARRNAPQPVAQWIRKLLESEKRPEIFVVEDDSCADREAFWIKHFRDIGCSLLNLSDGGERSPIGVKRSAETKQRMSEAQRVNQNGLGAVFTVERREAISRALKGNRHGSFERTQAHREITSKAMVGHVVSDATKEKIRKARAVQIPIYSAPKLIFVGKELTAKQWEHELGISADLINWRISAGWSVEKALTTKPRQGNYRRKTMPGEAVAPLPAEHAR